ncbi:MAG: hypothetical protein M1337_02720 [Actinobacteria bacterium]|nr:hypothetical protein [Actinomycetota bacterium]
MVATGDGTKSCFHCGEKIAAGVPCVRWDLTLPDKPAKSDAWIGPDGTRRRTIDAVELRAFMGPLESIYAHACCLADAIAGMLRDVEAIAGGVGEKGVEAKASDACELVFWEIREKLWDVKGMRWV